MDIMGMTITLGSLITIMGGVIALSNFFSGKTKKAKEDEARLVKIEAISRPVNTVHEKPEDKKDENID